MERRKFIKKSTAAAAGVSVLPLIPGTVQAASRIIGANDRVVVGLNKFQMDEEPYENLLRVDPSVRDSQIEKLNKLKDERDDKALEKALASLKNAASGTDNLMPYILDAVRAEGTLGEICDVMRGVFGEYKSGG